MRSFPTFAVALTVAAGAAHAQGGPGPRQPPPDHWMTIDSVATAVALTEAQRPAFLEHYDALNAVMKRAAEARVTFREEMGGNRPTPEAMQAFRTKLETMQKELDQHHSAMRAQLTEEQQGKFDALAKPDVQIRMGGRRPGG